MRPETPELVVRQHERFRCAVPASAAIAESSAGNVRLSSKAMGVSGTVPASVCDCSRGGLGFVSRVYFPPTCRVLIRLESPSGPIEFVVRVQRVRMTDRAPNYYLGAAFDDSTPDLAARIEAFLKAHAEPMEGPRA